MLFFGGCIACIPGSLHYLGVAVEGLPFEELLCEAMSNSYAKTYTGGLVDIRQV